MESNEMTLLPAGAPSEAELDKVATYVERSARAIKITTPGMYTIAVDEMQDLQRRLDEMNERRMSITRPMDAAKKAVMDLFRSPVERMETAIKALKDGLLEYQREEKRKAAEEAAKAQELARQERVRAEQQRMKEQAEAEAAQRKLAEQRRAAIEAEQRAMEAAAAGDRKAEEEASAQALAAQQEEARLQSEALAAQERADVAGQLALVTMATPEPASAVPKVRGLSTAAPWTAALVDEKDETKMALLKYVMENPQYIGFIDVNMKPIIQQAKSLQDKCQIPGIRVFQQESIRSRRN